MVPKHAKNILNFKENSKYLSCYYGWAPEKKGGKMLLGAADVSKEIFVK